MTTFQDQTLTCADCGQAFVFTAGEQQFYAEKGFTNTPKRCNDCRSKRKVQSRPKRGAGGGPRGSGGGRPASGQKFSAVCSRCGVTFDAPFEPKPDRPILCRTCFKPQRAR